jgi:Tol biopolymer transport system component
MTAHAYRAWLVIAAVTLPVFSACDKKLPVSPSSPARLASITTLATANTTADPPGHPPSNGPIAFVSDRDGAKAIYLANADGSGVTRLTSGDSPAWAPGGRRLSFQRGDSIYVVGADGSGEARVTAGSHPSWSPDGIMLAFTDTTGGIDLVNADGANPRRVFNPAVWNNASANYGASWPSWSPDGRSIAFVRTSFDDVWAVYVVDVDGTTDPRRLAQADAEGTSWSADGSRIAFEAPAGVVSIAFADGSGGIRGANGWYADWTPTGGLIFNQFTGAGDASNRLGSRMRIFLSTSSRALIPEAVAPVRPDYWDQHAVWAR